MFYYQLKKDCINIVANDDEDFVNQLWNQTYFSEASSMNEFLVEFGDSVFNFFNIVCDSSSSSCFVSSLLSEGYLTKEPF